MEGRFARTLLLRPCPARGSRSEVGPTKLRGKLIAAKDGAYIKLSSRSGVQAGAFDFVLEPV